MSASSSVNRGTFSYIHIDMNIGFDHEERHDQTLYSVLFTNTNDSTPAFQLHSTFGAITETAWAIGRYYLYFVNVSCVSYTLPSITMIHIPVNQNAT